MHPGSPGLTRRRRTAAFCHPPRRMCIGMVTARSMDRLGCEPWLAMTTPWLPHGRRSTVSIPVRRSNDTGSVVRPAGQLQVGATTHLTTIEADQVTRAPLMRSREPAAQGKPVAIREGRAVGTARPRGPVTGAVADPGEIAVLAASRSDDPQLGPMSEAAARLSHRSYHRSQHQ